MAQFTPMIQYGEKLSNTRRYGSPSGSVLHSPFTSIYPMTSGSRDSLSGAFL
jgi:hypothetical protein